MVKFNIPEEVKEGFKIYFSYSSSDRSRIFKLLDSESIGADPSLIAKKVSSALKIDKEDIETVFLAMFSLQRAVDSSNLNEDEFLDEIISTLQKSNITSSTIKEDLKEILSNKYLKISRKAAILASNRQSLLVSTRIISDIRPVYGIDNEKDQFKTSLIVHNLRIEYVENGDIKTIYFAIDSKDINRLQEHIERAKMKEKDIKEKFKGSTEFIELS